MTAQSATEVNNQANSTTISSESADQSPIPATAAKLWAGRNSGEVSVLMDQLNHSISFDQRLLKQDLLAGMAHATMLGQQQIIDVKDATAIVQGLQGMLADYETGRLAIDLAAEDVHTFVELELTRRIGEAGKKLHTGRSRNDQVTTDLRLYLAGAIDELSSLLQALIAVLKKRGEEHAAVLMPGYTHLQRAQPVTFGQHLGAYAAMFSRDAERLQQCRTRLMATCPLGAGALAGSSFPLDRPAVAVALGFSGVMENTLDAVSDRDYVLEFLSDAAIVMMHLSRFSEEIILWCSQEFGFIVLDDAFTTGSSMMPQKKNPDLAELVRGKTGRVYGDLMATLTMMKGLPLAYNKDMQEDKEALFDAVDTLSLCLRAFAPMIDTLQVNANTMRQAIAKGFLNATLLANYLTEKGIPFREAYQLAGQAVRLAHAENLTLDELSLAQYQALSPQFDEKLYVAITIQ
jgi:argininosuccinate lyase